MGVLNATRGAGPTANLIDRINELGAMGTTTLETARRGQDNIEAILRDYVDIQLVDDVCTVLRNPVLSLQLVSVVDFLIEHADTFEVRLEAGNGAAGYLVGDRQALVIVAI